MTALSPILLTCLLAGGTVFAGAPAKPDLRKYRHLWENPSVFTSPAPVKTVDIPDPFADWTLTGVSEIDGGYMVSMGRRNHPDETLIVRPDLNRRYTADRIDEIDPGTPGAFKVERVEFAGNWRDTVVFLSSGGRTGSIRFDGKALNPSGSSPPKDKVSSHGPATATPRQVQPRLPAPAAGRSR
ncbi:hypothetical protein [Luteolibacter sp. Populi]|uniref:hypothetical protein n=1 Tax=Luteolibacter sp. Populi TaxID=3230487 RepID=UPI0034662672